MQFTQGDLERFGAPADNVRMAKKPHFIREWRKFRGLTLEQLAERLHSTHATLSRIETFKQPYSQSMLERLAEELRTDPASLIMRDPSDPDGIWTVWDTLSIPERRQSIEVLKVIRGGRDLKTGTDER